MVKSDKGEFEEHEMRLPIHNNRILLETIEKRLDLHKPPLRINSVNNVPAVARPADKTLAFDLHDGQQLDLVAEVAQGRKDHVTSCTAKHCRCRSCACSLFEQTLCRF